MFSKQGISFPEKLNQYELLSFLPFSLLILFAVNRYLWLSQTPIYPTINRITMIYFYEHPVTSTLVIDQMIIICLGLITLYFLIQKKKILPVLGGFLLLAIYLGIQNEIAIDIFALLRLPAVISVIILNHYKENKFFKKSHHWKNLLYTSVAVLFCFELFVLILWIAFSFSPEFVKESILWHPVSLEYDMFYAMALASSALVSFTSFWFLTRPACSIILDSFKQTRKKIQDLNFQPNVVFNPKIILIIALGVSVIFAVYPFFPTINPQYTWVSVDEHAYLQFIKEINQQETIFDTLRQAFITSNGDRPLSLLAIYSLQVLGISLESAVRFFPVILGPALVFSVYLFVKEGLKNNHYAAYAALLTAFSYQIVVGIYAGFLANWLGLAVIFLCLLFLHRLWEKPSILNYAVVFGLVAVSLLVHVYAGAFLIAVILAFAITSAGKYRGDNEQKKKIFAIFSIFGIYATVILVRLFLFPSVLVDNLFSESGIQFSIEEFRNRWLNFPRFMYPYVGGFFANTVLLAFAFVWTLYAKYEKTFDRILLSTLVIGTIPLIFGDHVFQSRIFYDMPIQIAAALMIYRIVNTRSFHSFFAKIALLLITIHFAIYAIRSLSNLNLQGI